MELVGRAGMPAPQERRLIWIQSENFRKNINNIIFLVFILL